MKTCVVSFVEVVVLIDLFSTVFCFALEFSGGCCGYCHVGLWNGGLKKSPDIFTPFKAVLYEFIHRSAFS
jgi:hypothetical protein